MVLIHGVATGVPISGVAIGVPMAYLWRIHGVPLAYFSLIHGAPLAYPWRSPGVLSKRGTVMINLGRDQM